MADSNQLVTLGIGTIDRLGIEGTGSYGAGVARWLRAQGLVVIEVDRADRGERRRRESPQVSRRLMAALRDLRSIVPDERSAIIDEEIRLLEAAVEASLDEGADVATGLAEDREGIGVAAGEPRR